MDPAQCPVAVAALEKPFQRVLLRRSAGPPGSLPDDLLHPVKVRLADDGVMRPLIDDPVSLILRDRPLFVEAGLVPLAPHQCPGVLILVEDVQHRGRRPAVLFGGFAEPSAPRIFLPEVGAGGQDALAVQPAGDGGTAHPLQGHIEDTPHHRRRVPVYHQLVPDRGMELKAIGSEAAYVFALLHHDDLRRGGLDGQVLAVCLIDDVPQDHIHAGGHALVIIAVIAVIDGDIADAQEGKDTFQIVAHLGVITVASGKILCQFFEEPARSLQKIISELFISISAIVIIDWDVYNNIDIIVLVNNLGGANMSDINALLEKAINETAKLSDGEDFLLRDLFKGYEWNRISRSNRLLLGTLFLNKINSENLDISASAKTSSGQQKYQIVRRK